MNSALLICSLEEYLRQGELLLQRLSPEQYTQKVPQAFNGSIGGHYRHALEHIALLLSVDRSGSPGTALDYDLRARELVLETLPEKALERTRELLLQCGEWHRTDLDTAVTLSCKTSYEADAASAQVNSNLARELMFIISHTVHHYALIGVMCGMQNFAVPEGFGVAPSTLKHQATQKN